MTFLEQLQQSAGLLSENIANSSPFGNYTPMEASDFINTPFGQPIAQNRFEGNQFLMPDLSGSTYTPGNFSLSPGAGFNFGNMGTYNPGAFNQFYQAPMTSSFMPTTNVRQSGGRRDTNVTPREMSYQNRTFGDLGDRFTFSRDLDFGQAFDEFGRRRNIGPTLQGALQELGNFVTGGGIVGNAVKSLLGMDDETVTPETLQSLQNRAKQASLAEEASQARQQLANISGVNRSQVERDRDARNRGRGFSGRGTSDPGGQAARGV
jgi:hypothetical protein